MNGKSSPLYIPAPCGRWCHVLLVDMALPSPGDGRIWKKSSYPSSFLSCGILSSGFPPTHSGSPYLQTFLAKSCFGLILFCCGPLFLCLTFGPLSCTQEGEVGHGPAVPAHPSDLL